jgi:hypothetical protein
MAAKARLAAFLVFALVCCASAQNWYIRDLFDGRGCNPMSYSRRTAELADGLCRQKSKLVCAADGSSLRYTCNDDACNDCLTFSRAPAVRSQIEFFSRFFHEGKPHFSRIKLVFPLLSAHKICL